MSVHVDEKVDSPERPSSIGCEQGPLAHLLKVSLAALLDRLQRLGVPAQSHNTLVQGGKAAWF